MAKASSGRAVGKSKVIKTGTMAGVRGGNAKMFGKQSVKPAKAR